MERPYNGRATIHDNASYLEIIIPAKRNWFIILFIGAWLSGWLFGEVFAIGAVTSLFTGKFAGGFMLFWLAGWTVGGFIAIKTLLWNISGKEIITIGQGQLKISRKGAIFFRPKIYDLNEVKSLRVQEDISYSSGLFGRRNDFGSFNIGGIVRFDYGLQTVKFGAGLDEAEGKYILNTLTNKHFVNEKNLQ